jgi:hypothetical protein
MRDAHVRAHHPAGVRFVRAPKGPDSNRFSLVDSDALYPLSDPGVMCPGVRAVLTECHQLGFASPSGKAAWLLRAWEKGEFELIASVAPLAEFERALTYPKLRRPIPQSRCSSGGAMAEPQR